MHTHYILHIYLKNIEYGLDLEFDSKEEVQQVMDETAKALTDHNMKCGLMHITPNLIINSEDFIAMKITSLDYYDDMDRIPLANQTILDDFMPATVEVKYNEQ